MKKDLRSKNKKLLGKFELITKLDKSQLSKEMAKLSSDVFYVGMAKSDAEFEMDKAKARLNLMRIRRGSGSWESTKRDAHSIPFAVTGKCGSVKITLMPAPRGKGLCVERECAKILSLAGVKDVWSKTEGQTKTKLNLIYALLDALQKLGEVKVREVDCQKLGIVEGRANQ